MASFKFRIGTKLGLTASAGVLLVGGMLANQLIRNEQIAELSRLVVINTANKANAQGAELAVTRARLAIAEIGSVSSADGLAKHLATLRGSIANATTEIDAALERSRRAEAKELCREVKALLEASLKAGNDLSDARGTALGEFTAANQIEEAWNKAVEKLLASPAMAASQNRLGIEAELREADALLKAVSAADWRFSATGDVEQKDRIAQRADAMIGVLKQVRQSAGDKTIVEGIDALAALAGRYKTATSAAMKAEETKRRIFEERVLPAAKDITTRVDKLVAANNEFMALRQSQLMAALELTAQVSLAVGILVVLVLAGSALFSVLSIARPIRRIGEVLLQLAGGNKAVEIPYTTRGDEVGDNARAARTFKDNLIRIEQMEAEQKDQEAAAAARRKQEMIRLAGAFEDAVGGIINSVSAASQQLESAAGTLSGTAEETEHLSGMVAAASEEASANVGAVASAAEEMSASVVEIGRQVHDSSRIAGDAVKQAERTDARINELLKAAGRIGDVVKLITAIAEQTNLLALNATIEAARAGESGRGFAVVASEVKALAAQTARATDEIGAQIAGMQTATEDSVGAIKEIGATISKISDISTTIAATIEEQGAATAEIARNVSEAAKGTVEVADKIAQVSHGASATGSASTQVLASARSLSTESGRLKSEVAKFLDTVRAA
ncbi:chemotaxis protein [Bradyrhizobium nanningense]|uniref:Chemotaxis protein n=1 Tax=Bradyrhizobium nanningense TaxID=1325118 RepID=A0A4Q0RZJ5_9BRAD|nr:methyl-accepting chemotaxis protein [Bradyrhizobium nanningense]RXH24462.1 chemotaxis protein [Bradyrhizobium nanningense]RXH30718.1 chemotaxis protein [Bradyrhizobium nanningense]